MRQELFEKKLKEVRAHNAIPTHSYKKGINHMSDWTETERAGLRKNIPLKGIHAGGKKYNKTYGPVPHTIDWRQVYPPVLTAVKDQGYCGSCWAHAATESIETHNAIRNGELFVLSQQQITSCTPNPDQCGGTGGCSGNVAELAFDYIYSAGGIAQEWTYGYESYFGDSHSCRNNTGAKVVNLTAGHFTYVERNNADDLINALAFAGPLAISVDASSWPDYEGGIFNGCDYAKNISMDHAVQLVGAGHDLGLGMDYWIVRNSWNPSWGEQGYIRLHRHKTTQCGWNVDNQDGAGCKNDPSTIWTCGICGIAYDGIFPNVWSP